MAMTKKRASAPAKEQTKIQADESMVKSTPVKSSSPPWLAIAIIGVLILAAAGWYFTQPQAGPNPINTSVNNTPAADALKSASAVALLSSFDHLQSLPNSYNLSF